MRPRLQARAIIVLIAILASLWQLSYTFRYFRLTPKQKQELSESSLKKLERRALKLGLDLKGGMHLVLQVDASKLKENEIKGARNRALEIIRNRIDQFGVAEPQIARQGNNRIVIQLPGVVDRDRAKEIVGKTALLQFKLVEKGDKVKKILDDIDKEVYNYEIKKAKGDTSQVLDNPFLSLVYRGVVSDYDFPAFKKYLNLDCVKKVIPNDVEFLFSKEREREGSKYREIYIIKKKTLLTGDALVDARMGVGTPKNQMAPRVDLTMKPKARRRWASITGANVGRLIAIVLDGKVQSAPRVVERIVGGNSMIEMPGSSVDDAQDLALILRAGALPAPMESVEERSVGPTLGADSVRAGMLSIIIGGILVVLFMIAYYRGCGFIADIALFLNLLFLLAILSGFHATLTLPGIAGILLTIGTAVDANVLIFERIREELLSGKTTRAAIGTGFSRAFRTILDANLTTFFAALILYYFGTGPIRGFAVTLAIGIVCSFFTAIVVSRLILDWTTTRFPVKQLSI
jgi:protein-export membrane protein SecD